jgi:hypothetical protein
MPETTMPNTTGDRAVAEPSLVEQIRALLPDHHHEQPPAMLAFSTTWTWTTPLGTWTVRLGKEHLLAPSSLSFTGPGGVWVFARPDQRGVEQLAVVLRALDAIGGDTDG